MKRIPAAAFLFFALVSLQGLLCAEEAPITWQGTIREASEQHRAVLQMTKTGAGAWRAMGFYIEFVPDWMLQIDQFTAYGAKLRFTAYGGKGVFEGRMTPDGQEIDGTWSYKKQVSQVQLKRAGNESAWHVPFLYQYHYRDTTYLRPSADEPRIPFSPQLAMTYLEQGAIAWTVEQHCVACHTNGSYMVVRPMLTAQFGVPQKELRDYFVTALREQLTPDPDDPRWQPEPTQVVYIAAGLAIWDANVTHRLSPETAEALNLMFKLQRDTGDWYIDDDNNPPLESKTYQLATVAARAVANAPGWRLQQRGTPTEARIRRLEEFLRAERDVQGDYDRTDLLWTASEYPGLLDAKRMRELSAMVLSHQQPDGGWSIRTFARPEEWGKGNRAQKLREEPEFGNPPSDGHMTGLAIIALRKAGTPATDPRIQRGVEWLKANQRASGRWYTRSLNRDAWQFITYSGTAYPLLALSLCDALGPQSMSGTISGR